MTAYTIDELLHMHGYHDGTEQERLLLVFKDLARAKAVSAAMRIAIPAYFLPMVEKAIAEFVDK